MTTCASTEPPVWTEQRKICSYDVDYTRRATGATLCRYFLEAAWNHAEALGFGYSHLSKQNRFWVLSRLLLEVRQYPVWGAAVALKTWPRAAKSIFAMRDFEVLNANGATLAAGSSAWLVLDAATKRPQRLNKVLPGVERLGDKAALGTGPAKLAADAIGDLSFSALVRYSDIDVNRHVNSGRYIGWLLDAYPDDFHRQQSLAVLEVNYLGETVAGETVKVHTRQTGPTEYLHSITKDAADEVCRARLQWTPTATDRQA